MPEMAALPKQDILVTLDLLDSIRELLLAEIALIPMPHQLRSLHTLARS